MSHSIKQDPFVFPSIEQSFLIVIMLAVKADKIFSQSEKEVIKQSLLPMKLFENYSEEQLSSAIKKALLRIEIEGEDIALREAAKNLPSELHKFTFSLAVDLIVSDSKITQAEQVVLDKIQHTLSISINLAQRIISEKSLRINLLKFNF
ncbi:MAG: tellurite resistance TerB family protein [Prochloraceae cyanobacterium]